LVVGRKKDIMIPRKMLL